MDRTTVFGTVNGGSIPPGGTMYRLIIFDLGGVLFTNGTRRFIEALCSRYPLGYDEVKQILDEGIGSQYRKGKLSRDRFWQQVITHLNLKETPGELEQEWINFYQLIPETKEIIAELKNRYQVWYLSNNVKERAEALEKKFGFKAWFDGGIFSHEVGLVKPDPQIYRLVLERARVPAGETVFIDDKESSLTPANALGIMPILFVSPRQLKAKLKEMTIL